MAKTQYEERQAHTIAQETHQRSRRNDFTTRKRSTGRKSQYEVHSPGDQPLEHGYLDRVGRRQLARQIVVYAPAEAGTCDEDGAPLEGGMPCPGQEHRSRQDRERAQQQPTVHVFTEDYPGDSHGRQAFQIQKQRRSGCWCPGKTEHQEQRPQHSAR